MRVSLLVAAVVLAACPAPGPGTSPTPEPTPEPTPVSDPGLDCHMHLRSTGALGEAAASVVGVLDAAGLARGCVLSSGYVSPDDCTEGCPEQRPFTEGANDDLLAEAATRADRLLPFCGIPLGFDWAPDEVARCAGAGARGLKLHSVSQGVSLRDASVAESFGAVLAAAGTAGLPVLIHVDDTLEAEVRAFFELVAAHPATVVIAAHQIARSLALLVDAPSNLYVEVSGVTFVPVQDGGGFVDIWRAFGIERVLLGSDWSILDPSEHVAWIEAVGLEQAEIDAILDGNGRRLLPPGATGGDR